MGKSSADDCTECRALKDIESFCQGRMKTGVMTAAYRDVLYLVRQHKCRLSEKKETGELLDTADFSDNPVAQAEVELGDG